MKPKSSSHSNKEKAPPFDVLVLGDHPSAYLAAMLLHASEIGKGLRVIHATLPDQAEPDRLVVINPAFFSLHPSLETLRRRLDLTAIYGLQFVSDEPGVHSEYRSKSGLAFIASSKQVRSEVARLAENLGVQSVVSKHLEIHRVDETGLDFTVNKRKLRAKSLLLGGALPPVQHKMLGLPESWDAGVMHRYSYIRLPAKKWSRLGARPVAPMSLNLRDTLCWGWLLPGPKHVQIAVAQPVEMLGRMPANDLLNHWARTLRQADVLQRDDLPADHVQHVDLPLTGALAHEGVANRTLLIGPAGGFYGASSEDIYPNCWSTLFAAESLAKALKEPHLQDALNPYRSKWRTTLGQYLRGPQQDFRFLLPLIYRNEVMTARLTESILLGKSVVR